MRARPLSWLLPVLALVLTLLPVPAGAAAASAKRHVAIELIAEADTVAPGGEIWVALKQTIEPGWHTYWINPGDSGEPTSIRWQLPAGFSASAINWPVPELIRIGALANHGYSDTVLLLTRITAPSASQGQIEVRAEADWLVCADICVPESGSASLTLQVAPVAADRPPSRNGLAIAAARRLLPEPSPWPVRMTVGPDRLELVVQGIGTPGVGNADRRPKAHLFPVRWGEVQHAAPQETTWRGGDLVLTLARGDLKTGPLTSLDGVLVLEEMADGAPLRQGFSLTADATNGGQAAGAGARGPDAAPQASSAAGSGSAGPADSGGIGLARALLFALLGGLILNLMPCVLPVLSLKALAFARHREEDARPAAHGLSYLAGVLASFAVLAGVLLVLRGMGQALGWGFQFQSAAFVLGLAGLFFGLGLSLSGVFSFGAGIAGAGEGLARRPGLAGSFFTGALATIAATPCTAPFMGAAVGYAIAAPAAVAVAVLLAMGLGFAAPMVALSASPALRRLLPRPGAWMETFKQALAFPLYATSAWLVWVLSMQEGSDGVLAAMVLLTGIGFAGWLFGLTEHGPRLARALPVALVIAVALLSLRLLGPLITAPSASSPSANAKASGDARATAVARNAGPPALAFSNARLEELRASGRPVFVNLTAAWCITCKVNEQVALSSARIGAAFAEHDVAYLKGDWTRQDPEITRFLQKFGRAGVPLYLIYPKHPQGSPVMLPQLLTEATVLSEIRSAVRPVQ